MALPILDGNQSATTLSTILSSGQHITAHTVVSLGTQAITDIVNATSAGLTDTQLRASVVTVGGTVTIGSLPAISGTVTANVFGKSANTQVPLNMALSDEAFNGANRVAVALINSEGYEFGDGVNALPISGTVTVGNSVTIANFPATQAVSIASVTIGNSVTISNFPATQAVSIASVTIGNTSVTVNPIQGSAGAITSVTAIAANSTMIAASATRKALTVYNAGPSAFFISPIATCTSIAGGYQVSLNSGDYWECPPAQITLAHTACFASSGSTAGITAIS